MNPQHLTRIQTQARKPELLFSVKLSHCPQFLPTRPKQLSLQLPEGPCGFLITSPVQSQLG